MTQPEAKAILLTAFAALTPEQRANMAGHIRDGMGVYCGRQANYWYDSTDNMG